jgi:hypothetical protein
VASVETFRHQVALWGLVSNAETKKPAADAEVSIVVMPESFKQKLKAAAQSFGTGWAALTARLDRTRTQADGLFYFLDLPDGKYTLAASLPASGKRYGTAQATATVVRDARGNVKMTTVNLAVQPTVVKGRVSDASQKSGVVMAEVRVKGSGERVFSDQQGEFVLFGIEPGMRTLSVFARGYREMSQLVTLKEPEASQTVNFELVRESG